jgi:hypothetical protein
MKPEKDLLTENEYITCIVHNLMLGAELVSFNVAKVDDDPLELEIKIRIFRETSEPASRPICEDIS